MHASTDPIRRPLAPTTGSVEWVRQVTSAACRGVAAETDLLPRDVDDGALLAYAERHALVPLLGWHLKSQRQCDGLSPELDTALTTGLHASMARSLSQLDELRRIVGGFAAEGIEVMPWKGPLLSERLFGQAGVRECADLDLLVAPGSQASAQRIIEALGYRQHLAGEVTARWNEDHCLAWEHGNLPVAVELHMRPFPRSFPFPLDAGHLPRAAQVQRSDDGPPLPRLAAEAELLLLCAHGAKHLWSRLAWVADIARMLVVCPGLDATALRRLADRARCRRAVQLSLCLAENVLDVAPPPDVARAFDEPAKRDWLADRSRFHASRMLDPDGSSEARPAGAGEWLRLQRLRAGSREALRDRLRVFDCAARQALAPNANDRAWVPGIRLPVPLAFVLRPLRLLAKFARRSMP